ncbi:MAG: DNA repair protein RecO [Parachlamydiales bacterium]|jgi:DNA repair protein RecO
MLIETQGITLKSTPFKDRSKILQVLTKNLGVISLIVNGLSNKNLNLINLCSLFTISELIIKKTNSDIYSLQEAHISEANLHLRKNLKMLNSASYITKAVLDSHFPQKQSSSIYLLFKTYLKKIDTNPDALYLSFLIKFLSLEGLINLKPTCSNCDKPALNIKNGECFCEDHSEDFSFNFSNEDFEKLLLLCYAKSFSLIEQIDVSLELKEKTNALFYDLI